MCFATSALGRPVPPRGLDQEGSGDHAQGTQTTRKERHGLGVTAQALANGTHGTHGPKGWVSNMKYPLVMTNIAIENDHRNSEFSQ